MLFEPNDFSNEVRKARPIDCSKARRKFRSHARTTSSFKYRTQVFLRSVDRSKVDTGGAGLQGPVSHAHALETGVIDSRKRVPLKD
jgi:hypothetical protein